LSFDEHREMGREMKATVKRLRALCDLFVEVYGPHNRAAFSFLKAMEAIEHLEQDLATQATWDLPGYNASEFYLDRGRQNPSSPPTSLPMMAPRGVEVHSAAAFMRRQAPRAGEVPVDRAADAPPKDTAPA